MFFTDVYIKGREKLMNGILGIDPRKTFNPAGQAVDPNLDSYNLAAEIKKQINQFKVIAMDLDGQRVNYHRLSLTPEYSAYSDLVSRLASFDYKSLTSQENRLAFWINLYNALVIDAVIQEEVKTSVTESRLGILSFFQRAAYLVNGERFSLTDIEHGVIRGNRGFPYFPGPHFSSDDPRIDAVMRPIDPRIHFALNCASNSCPPIGVYSGERLDDQLNLAARNFINNDLVLDKNNKIIKISQIFRWYQADFGGKKGIIDFLIKFVNDQDKKEWLAINQSSIQVNYHSYDWSLNQLHH